MTRATIHGGTCGMTTVVRAASEDMQHVSLEIESACGNIRDLAAALSGGKAEAVLDAWQEMGDGFNGAVHAAARKSLTGCCAGCIVPSGIFKTAQTAAGTALPAVATITIEKDQ